MYVCMYVYICTHPNCLGGPNFDPPNPTTVWVQYFGWDGWDPWSSLAQGAQESWRPLQWNSWPSEGMATANLKWSMWPRPGAMTKKNLPIPNFKSFRNRLENPKIFNLPVYKTLNRRINQINQQKKHNSSQHPLLSLKISGTTVKATWLTDGVSRSRGTSPPRPGTSLDSISKNPPEGVGVFLGKMDG